MTSAEIIERLKTFANDAKRDISWLAAIHVALRSKEGDVILISNKLLIYPDVHLQVQNYSPAQSRKIRQKMIEYFNTFGNLTTEGPSFNPAGYLNKSVILYVDAIIQAFLDKIFDLMIDIGKISTSTDKKQSIGGKLSSMDSILPVTDVISSKHVKFLSQLRHIITHNNGFVNDKFISNCGIDPGSLKLLPSNNQLWDERIWPDEVSFLNDYKKDSQLTLAIDKVLIPYLHNSIVFIDEYLSKISCIVKNNIGT